MKNSEMWCDLENENFFNTVILYKTEIHFDFLSTDLYKTNTQGLCFCYVEVSFSGI